MPDDDVLEALLLSGIFSAFIKDPLPFALVLYCLSVSLCLDHNLLYSLKWQVPDSNNYDTIRCQGKLFHLFLPILGAAILSDCLISAWYFTIFTILVGAADYGGSMAAGAVCAPLSLHFAGVVASVVDPASLTDLWWVTILPRMVSWHAPWMPHPAIMRDEDMLCRWLGPGGAVLAACLQFLPLVLFISVGGAFWSCCRIYLLLIDPEGAQYIEYEEFPFDSVDDQGNEVGTAPAVDSDSWEHHWACRQERIVSQVMSGLDPAR